MSSFQLIDYWRYMEFSNEFFDANNCMSVLDCDAWWNLGFV
jgi:hypothetical protein